MFTTVGTLESFGAPVLRREVITNSVVSTVGDSVKVASGFIALATAGDAVFGHLSSHADDAQVGLSTTGATGAEQGSYTNTYTAASNNQTVSQVTAVCDISKKTLYSADADAALGTTTGSDLSMYHMDLAGEDELDESTAATTSAQYLTWGVDPNDSGNAIVSIFESQVFN
jgi:hypothetical protein